MKIVTVDVLDRPFFDVYLVLQLAKAEKAGVRTTNYQSLKPKLAAIS